VNTRAVVFGAGDRLIAKENAEARHDLVGRLEANEWGGAVEPRLVLRSLHPLGKPAEGEEGVASCAGCSCRAQGADWWSRVWREVDRPLANSAGEVDGNGSGEPRTVIDSRDHGALGCLSDLLSTDESVAVACADTSRRRSLIDRELAPARFGRPPAQVLSASCAEARIAERLRGAPPAETFCLVDYATISESPALLQGFTHVFALDPPPFERVSSQLAASGSGGSRGAFFHLAWGQAEVEFAQRMLEHEYSLRPALTAIYRALASHRDGLSGAPLEAALAGHGRHPRTPVLAGRCLRVLGELGLIEVDRSSATVRCTKSGEGKVNLERSQAFHHYTRTYEEGLRFLSGLAQPMRRARAA
jgi:single-stranded-DNA-specific exonuclease